MIINGKNCSRFFFYLLYIPTVNKWNFLKAFLPKHVYKSDLYESICVWFLKSSWDFEKPKSDFPSMFKGALSQVEILNTYHVYWEMCFPNINSMSPILQLFKKKNWTIFSIFNSSFNLFLKINNFHCKKTSKLHCTIVIHFL